MSANLQSDTVKDLQAAGVLLVEDGNHGENRPRPDEFSEQGVSFIRAADLDSGHILFGSASKINDRALRRIRKGVGRPGDIILSHKGTVGKLAAAPLDCEPFVCSPQTTFWRVLQEDRLDRRFLYFFMNSMEFKNQLSAVKGETDMADYVSLTAQRRLKIPRIPLAIQQEIGRVLGSLDNKIELNQRMNETLEAMAQAIFRDWFVDFGPTHRKLEGATDPLTIMGGLVQDTERAQALADLFPAALGDDGLPEGWTFCRLEDVLELAYGKALPKGERRDGTIPVYGSGGVGGFHDTALVSGPSVIVGRKGTVGSLYWEDDDFYPIDTVFYVKSKRPMTYCYQLLQTLGLETMNTDAAVPGLNRNNAYRLEVPQPHNSKLLSEFGEIADVLRSKTTANVRENRTLAAIRDLLLPKLMSGEIRLQNAEKPIEVRV